MKIVLIFGIILLPLIMFFAQKYLIKFRLIFNIGALISTFVFGNITSLSIYQIIKDNTVLMTNIHAVFLNPFFLITGSYMGVYILYRLLIVTAKE
ncbi:transposase [Virgibacillus ndiopensis]|uniref:transposase n=1 Tax=Virgibacillus ndiopensis TaxID=2004408 RepID=UPI000C086BD7|nr:transposase [Virgibacillus ndiopensis]